MIISRNRVNQTWLSTAIDGFYRFYIRIGTLVWAKVHEAAEVEATGRRRVQLIFRSLFFTTPYRQLSSLYSDLSLSPPAVGDFTTPSEVRLQSPPGRKPLDPLYSRHDYRTSGVVETSDRALIPLYINISADRDGP